MGEETASIGQRIDRYRRLARIDVTDLIDRLGISRSTYYYRLHHNAWPNSDIERLADILGVTPAMIIVGERDSTQLADTELELLSESIAAILRGLDNLGLSVVDVGSRWLARAALAIFAHSRASGRIDPGMVRHIVDLAPGDRAEKKRN